ncbi:ChaN family lipoprotein [Pseudoalteromonas fenneropenaei]|uniref:ChaN family lipoprotein n=1 Tax=Pseudoalteromonas fenneropenaei TaxID=1737459 RepID=A0ABV7CJJ3_9GAMM
MTKPAIAQQLAANLATAYDYQLLDANYQPVTEPKLVASLAQSDVVLIGEYHGNHASHLLQMRLLAALHIYSQQQNRPLVLSMEMFTREQQTIVDDYLAGKVGEHYLINKAPAWKNYSASYRPLVEYAKQHGLPIIAANAPADVVRCIGAQGETYVDKLPLNQRRLLAEAPFMAVPNYADKFYALMVGSGHTVSERAKQSYAAQLARDNTMAEAILTARRAYPNALVVHINGSFHSAERLGTAGALLQRAPALKVRVVTPLYPDAVAEQQAKAPQQDEMYYLLKPLPPEYVDEAYKQSVFTEMFKTAKEKAKACL